MLPQSVSKELEGDLAKILSEKFDELTELRSGVDAFLKADGFETTWLLGDGSGPFGQFEVLASRNDLYRAIHIVEQKGCIDLMEFRDEVSANIYCEWVIEVWHWNKEAKLPKFLLIGAPTDTCPLDEQENAE